MAQDNKKKFFTGRSYQELDEILSYTEEELIKEELNENLKNDFFEFLEGLEETSNSGYFFFEDKGMIYGLSENVLLQSKLKKIN